MSDNHPFEIIDQHHCFGGQQLRFRHRSTVLNCDMTLALYLPPQASIDQPVPLLYWLSGLTCSDENFVTKAGAQRYAAEHGIAIVCPDTSPRGESVPDDPQQAYDFGLGAGFYVDATQPPWSSHYRMYSYIVDELPQLLASETRLDLERCAISGHSMGGHGAITIALKNPQRFRSVSAFAPICAPSQCPWGQKALGGYLGEDKSTWSNYDTVELLKREPLSLPLLVDQGAADNFLAEQLKPDLLETVLKQCPTEMSYQIRLQPDYDHSYFFIATFISEHIAFHARYLSAEQKT